MTNKNYSRTVSQMRGCFTSRINKNQKQNSPWHLQGNQALLSLGAFRSDDFPHNNTGHNMLFETCSWRAESILPSPTSVEVQSPAQGWLAWGERCSCSASHTLVPPAAWRWAAHFALPPHHLTLSRRQWGKTLFNSTGQIRQCFKRLRAEIKPW